MSTLFERSFAVRLSGRATRRDFWIGTLLTTVLMWAGGIAWDILWHTPISETAWYAVQAAASLLHLWLALVILTLFVRRLHDIGRSGLWLLLVLLLLPFFVVSWICLGSMAGEAHENRWGPDPYGRG